MISWAPFRLQIALDANDAQKAETSTDDVFSNCLSLLIVE